MELKIENLKSGYGQKTIIENIYFTASAGKVTGIVGPNGVGKSMYRRTSKNPRWKDFDR